MNPFSQLDDEQVHCGKSQLSDEQVNCEKNPFDDEQVNCGQSQFNDDLVVTCGRSGGVSYSEFEAAFSD